MSESDNSSSGDDESNDEMDDDDHKNAPIVFETSEEGYAYDLPEDVRISGTNIVGQFRQAWNKRRKKLVHDYSITGWMLSPIPAIMEDAVKHHKGFHRLAVDRLIKKLLAPSSDFFTEQHRNEAVGNLLNTFWTEHEHFHSKGGPFANREHIWQSKDIHGKYNRFSGWLVFSVTNLIVCVLSYRWKLSPMAQEEFAPFYDCSWQVGMPCMLQDSWNRISRAKLGRCETFENRQAIQTLWGGHKNAGYDFWS